MSEIFRETHFDTLVAFSHNIGPLRRNGSVINDPDHLSPEAKIITDASCLLYYTGVVGSIIFSSGPTIPGIPAESISQRLFAMKHYPKIDPSNSHVEDKSWDTSTNALYSKGVITANGYKTVAVISIGAHGENGARYLNHFGQAVERIFKAEEVIYDALEILDPNKARQFKRDFDLFYHKSGNSIKELIRRILIKTIDPCGLMLRWIASVTRQQFKYQN